MMSPPPFPSSFCGRNSPETYLLHVSDRPVSWCQEIVNVHVLPRQAETWQIHQAGRLANHTKWELNDDKKQVMGVFLVNEDKETSLSARFVTFTIFSLPTWCNLADRKATLLSMQEILSKFLRVPMCCVCLRLQRRSCFDRVSEAVWRTLVGSVRSSNRTKKIGKAEKSRVASRFIGHRLLLLF